MQARKKYFLPEKSSDDCAAASVGRRTRPSAAAGQLRPPAAV